MQRRFFIASSSAALVGPSILSRFQSQATALGNKDYLTKAAEEELAGPSQGPWRRLFLDASVIEKQESLTRVFHSAEKYDGNPIIVPDRPWEGTSAIIGPYVYGTIIREDSLLRMWYQVLFQGNHVGYAESQDGLFWTKPVLPYISYENSTPTNLVVSAFQPEVTGGGHCHNPAVIRRPNEPDPERRYALYGYDGKAGHPRVAFSSDGLKWNYLEESEKQPLFNSSDVVNFFYDPYQDCYFCTWKTRNRRGRAVGVAKSKDGIVWTKPLDGPVFVADDHDPDDTQIYGMPVFPYQGMYIGQPWIYRARYFRYGEYSVEKLHEAQSDSPRTIEPQLAWSWDLIHWTRPIPREPLIALGQSGQWDGGMIVTARAPIIMNDQLYFYFGGTDKAHDEKRVRAGIGLATLRLDGFCSMLTSPGREGWLITRREPMQRPIIRINARTERGGSITADLLDRNNRVVPGFSRQDCVAFQGDSVRHEMQWKTGEFALDKKREDYKVRFWLRDAELFSYIPTSLDPERPDIARLQSTGP